MSRKVVWTLGVVVIAILIVIIVVISRRGSLSSNVAQGPAIQQAQTAGPASSKTRLEVPAGTTVPGLNSSVATNVAKPETIIAQSGGFNYRSFNIQVNNDKFIPDTVIVNAGDDVYINFLAIDKNYDFKQPDNGFFATLPKGQKKVLHGQFPATGKFILYCQSCGGPDKGPIAYIVVVSK
jgi:plastocyanin